jgi:hypothetical protein
MRVDFDASVAVYCADFCSTRLVIEVRVLPAAAFWLGRRHSSATYPSREKIQKSTITAGVSPAGCGSFMPAPDDGSPADRTWSDRSHFFDAPTFRNAPVDACGLEPHVAGAICACRGMRGKVA